MSEKNFSTTMDGHSGMQSEPGMKIKIPSLATRRAACTHMTMKRQYGHYQCDICRLPSPLGWVYVCIQDGGAYPVTDSADGNPYLTNSQATDNSKDVDEKCQLQSTYRMPTLELAPGVAKAIRDDQYSPEQMRLLRDQKRKVVQLANATVEQFQREAHPKDTPRFHSSPSSRSLSLSISQFQSLSISRSQSKDLGKGTAENGAKTINLKDSSPTPQLRMFPYCKFQACQTCRPTYRDRAWQSFDGIYSTDVSRIIESQNFDPHENRPLISRKLMQDIGRRAPAIADLASQAVTMEPQDITDVSSESEAEMRMVRESMRRKFLQNFSGRDVSCSGKRRKLNWEPKTSLDTAFWKALDENTAQEAARIPLPGQDITTGLVDTGGEDVVMSEDCLEMNEALI